MRRFLGVVATAVGASRNLHDSVILCWEKWGSPRESGAFPIGEGFSPLGRNTVLA